MTTVYEVRRAQSNLFRFSRWERLLMYFGLRRDPRRALLQVSIDIAADPLLRSLAEAEDQWLLYGRRGRQEGATP